MEWAEIFTGYPVMWGLIAAFVAAIIINGRGAAK